MSDQRPPLPGQPGQPGQPGYQPGYQPGQHQPGQHRPGGPPPGAPYGGGPRPPQQPSPASYPQQPRRGSGALGAGVVVGALVLGVVGGIGGAAGYSALVDDDGIFSSSGDGGGSDGDTRIQADDLDTGSIDPLDLVSVNDISNAVLPAVVQINVPVTGGYSQGSGFVVSDDGEILTNHHVIEGGSSGEAIVITFDDGTLAEAEVVGSDPLLDVALLRLTDAPDDLTVASLGSSDETEVGQAVVAIGAPYGLQSTVTAGIVSALNRPFVLELPEGLVAYPAIQTDAAVNSGNSGGPLVNLRGEVIGINGAIELAQSDQGYDAGFIGISYAIPIDDVRHIVDQLREGEEPEHASLGANAETAVVENIVDGAAVLTELAPDGAAAQAGLEEGDMITEIGELHVNSARALVTSVLTFEPGEDVEVSYIDGDGNEETTTVTLGSDLDD